MASRSIPPWLTKDRSQPGSRGSRAPVVRLRAQLPRPLARWLQGPVTPLDQTLAAKLSLLVLGYLLAGYWLSHYILPGRMSPDLQIYLVRPFMWLALGLLCMQLWRRVSDRPLAGRTLLGLAALAAAFNISALLCAGVLLGFGHSPYSRQLFHMTQNAWYLATFIFGLEMARAYLLAAWSRYNGLLAFAAVSLLIGGLWFAPGMYDNVMVHDRTLPTLGRTFLPGAAESVMATFLASIGGPLPAFVYHFSLEAFRWLSPILPRLEWAVAAFVGTLAPAVAMLIVRDTYFAAQEDGATAAATADADQKRAGVSPLLLGAGALVVALIWFNTGMLGVKPYLVSGPSMKPSLTPGDLVVMKDVDPADIQVGDVIIVAHERGDVIHRVIDIQRTNQGLMFVTRGDNNNTEDAPAPASSIRGKMVLEVPYVGWLPIKFKDLVGG